MQVGTHARGCAHSPATSMRPRLTLARVTAFFCCHCLEPTRLSPGPQRHTRRLLPRPTWALGAGVPGQPWVLAEGGGQPHGRGTRLPTQKHLSRRGAARRVPFPAVPAAEAWRPADACPAGQRCRAAGFVCGSGLGHPRRGPGSRLQGPAWVCAQHRRYCLRVCEPVCTRVCTWGCGIRTEAVEPLPQDGTSGESGWRGG